MMTIFKIPKQDIDKIIHEISEGNSVKTLTDRYLLEIYIFLKDILNVQYWTNQLSDKDNFIFK